MMGSGLGHLCIRQVTRESKTAKGLYESGVASDH